MQQIVSGTFRSTAGTTVHCRVCGALSTLAKQGTAQLAAPLVLFSDDALRALAAT